VKGITYCNSGTINFMQKCKCLGSWAYTALGKVVYFLAALDMKDFAVLSLCVCAKQIHMHANGLPSLTHTKHV